MRIGVDFDNTIICYDGVFHAVAVEQGIVPENVGRTKTEVRDWLRSAGREEAWTELQGLVYGACLSRCRPYADAFSFLAGCLRSNVPVFVVSHKTLYPYLGPRLDLHRAARDWIDAMGLHGTGLAKADVYFELTKADKLARIASLGCTHFIDDLPEICQSECEQAQGADGEGSVRV